MEFDWKHHAADLACVLRNEQTNKPVFWGIQGQRVVGYFMLPDFTKKHFKNIEELVLVVNHANIPAQNFYKKSGFSDTGMRLRRFLTEKDGKRQGNLALCDPD